MRLVGIYRLPSPLVFHEVCAGTSVKTYIGDYDANIWLPSFIPPQSSFGMGSVRAPIETGVPEHVFARMLAERPSPSSLVPTWGRVISADTTGHVKLMVVDVFIEYELLWRSDFDIDLFDGERRLLTDFFVSTEFFGKIDPWFARVSAWASVLTGQPVDRHGRIRGALTEGEGLVVAARDEAGYTAPSLVGWSVTTYDANVPALSLLQWQEAARLAEQSSIPEASDGLIVDAVAALTLGEHRLAVIQAATAVEVALGERLQADVEALDSPIATAFAKERRTLGALIASLGTLYGLPGSARELVTLRNQSVHKNYMPTLTEADKAIDVAKEILAALAVPHS